MKALTTQLRRAAELAAVGAIPAAMAAAAGLVLVLARVRATRPALAAYLLWMLLDRDAPRKGGRPWRWLRRLAVFRLMRGYFPLRLYETAPLPPGGGPYVIGLHPHGVLSYSTFGHFVGDTGALGVDYRILTVDANFRFPIMRDLCMGLGFVSASPESVEHLLRRRVSVAVVVGGAAESLDARPGTNDLTLAGRTGFVRMAMRHGADLVPVYAFGENEVYRQVVPNPPGSWVRRLQEWLIRVAGFTVPLVSGVAVLLPRRRPVYTVVGRPVPVGPPVDDPTPEQVAAVHARYVAALEELFASHRNALLPESSAPLRIVDGADGPKSRL